MKIILCFAALLLLPASADAIQVASPGSADVFDAEIASLHADPRIAVARDHITAQHDARLRDLVTLTEIPAPPFGEGARGLAFAEMLRETGFGAVSIDEVGNVLASREGTVGNRTVMMAAHIDTVFPEDTDVTVTVEGQVYTAPGVSDNVRGMVMLLEIASAIAAAEIRVPDDIVLVGNVGEEGLGDLRGTRHLFREGAARPGAFIAIDGGDDARIISSAIGSQRYRATFGGEGGHSWSDFGAANPHHAAARAITRFADTALPVTSEGPRSSFSVGRTGGGTSVNSIPFESWFEVDMRSGDPEKLAALDAVFQTAMQLGLAAENRLRSRNAPLTVEIENIGRRPAGQGDRSAALVRRAEAALRVASITPNLTASSTDSNIPISLYIPAITISRCGISGRAHSLDEYWIDDETVVDCTLRGMMILLLEAGVVR